MPHRRRRHTACVDDRHTSGRAGPPDDNQRRPDLADVRRDRIGINARLDAVHAPVLRAKLRRLDPWNDARRVAAARYGELLADIDGVRPPVVHPWNEDAWHLYVVQVDARDRVMAQMNKAGVGVALHYPTPIHLTEAYAGLGYGRGQCPVSKVAADQIGSLPMFPHLTNDS